MKTINISALSAALTAMNNCTLSGNHEMAETWDNYILAECEKLPSGSGIDSGMELVREECEPKKIVFSLGFHHLNENGYYDGWTQHKAIITPSFGGIDIRITGRDRNQIKDYLYQMFYDIFDGKPYEGSILKAVTA
jgi:hypothetical protein